MSELLEKIKVLIANAKGPLRYILIVAALALCLVWLLSCATPGMSTVKVVNRAEGVTTHVSISNSGQTSTVSIDPAVSIPPIINPNNN